MRLPILIILIIVAGFIFLYTSSPAPSAGAIRIYGPEYTEIIAHLGRLMAPEGVRFQMVDSATNADAIIKTGYLGAGPCALADIVRGVITIAPQCKDERAYVIVAHELGHLAGYGHGGDGEVMQRNAAVQLRMSTSEIRALRSLAGITILGRIWNVFSAAF